MLEQLRLAIRHPNDSGSGSEEQKMSKITLSYKAAKLMKLCDLEGYKRFHDLLKASASDSLCPAICMTEGCDYTTEMERDQDAGTCATFATCTRARALWGLTFRTEMSAHKPHKHGICSMTTVVRCPRTGHACSEGACRGRHWCRQLFERGLSHRGAAFEAQISTKVLRQDSSRSSVHHEERQLA
jgi:hypothetical protein